MITCKSLQLGFGSDFQCLQLGLAGQSHVQSMQIIDEKQFSDLLQAAITQ